jgi:hypothetical protein
MKTISSAMRDHLDGTTTNLTTCWKITRTDGEEFFLTENSVDVVFDGDTYLAADTYDRSAIAASGGLDPDNLEVFALLNSDAIEQQDLENGKFDWAEVELFAVNYTDPDTYGKIILRSGRFGEIQPLTNAKGFTATFFGLKEYLNASIERIVSPTCGADLGDDSCRLPIVLDEIERDTEYSVGDRVAVRIKTLKFRGGDEVVQNGDFTAEPIGTTFINLQAPEGWTSNGGQFNIHATDRTKDEVLPDHIDRFLQQTLYGTDLHQVLTLTDGVTTEDDITNNRVWCFFSAWIYHDEFDRRQVKVVYLDEDDNEVGTPVVDTGMVFSEDNPYNPDFGNVNTGWFRIRAISTDIPATARKISVQFDVEQTGGPSTDNGTADVVCSVMALDSTQSSELDFAGRYALVTTAGTTASTQPTYSDTVGATVTDGTAELYIDQAWRVVGVVADVTDRSNFTLIVPDDERGKSNAGWYDGAVIQWLQGENAGRSIEAKTTAAIGGGQDAYDIETWLPNARLPKVGDVCYIQPGCDKLRETCRDKFDNILNYQGFPDLPGQDEIDTFHAS